jgi:hypothetical protein
LLMRTLRSQVRWIMIAIVILFVLSIFGMYGFDGARRAPSGGGEDYVVAEIDGRAVMRSTLEEQLRGYVERANIKDITSADIPHLYQAALDNIAIFSRLSREAAESGLKAADTEIDDAVKEVSEQFPTKEAFMQYLERSGIKMSAFRENLAREVVQRKLMEKSMGSLEVTDEEAKELYEQLKPLFFHSPAGWSMDFVRVKTAEDAGKIRALASEGKDWSDAVSAVAPENVIDKTPDTGPIYFPESAFKDYMAVMPFLKEGEVSPVMEIASDDLMIAVKRGKVEEKTALFEEVSGDVKGILMEEKARKAQSDFFQGLKERAVVVIHDESLFPKAETADEPASKNDGTDASAPGDEGDKK